MGSAAESFTVLDHLYLSFLEKNWHYPTLVKYKNSMAICCECASPTIHLGFIANDFREIT